MLEVNIPFAGFYGSMHDAEFDREIEYALEGLDDPNGALQNLAFDSADFGAARLEYAREYATAFLDWLGLTGESSGLESPRFYNFETDRVFVRITRDSVARMWRGVDRATFAAKCRERFTSRSGFISHYSADWRDWGALPTWDHNQLGTLALVYAETEKGTDWSLSDEVDLMETCICNGGVHNALWDGERGARFWRIVNYLRERESRPIRTMAQWHAARRAENRPFNETPLGAYAG